MAAITARGVSSAAEFVENSERSIKQRFREAVTFSREDATDAVWELLDRCSEPGWDGDASVAVAFDTCNMAASLIEALPSSFPSPVVSPEPDGHIDLEWYTNPRRILSASMSPEGVIYWAALIGTEDMRGSCHFIDEFPSAIRQCIARIFST